MGTKTRGGLAGPVDSEKVSLSFAAGNIGTATVTTKTVALTGVRTTDVVTVCPTAALAAGISLSAAAYVSAANELTLYFTNPTAAQVAGGTVEVKALVHRFTS